MHTHKNVCKLLFVCLYIVCAYKVSCVFISTYVHMCVYVQILYVDVLTCIFVCLYGIWYTCIFVCAYMHVHQFTSIYFICVYTHM